MKSVFCNLISERAFHQFRCILLVRGELPGPADISREEIGGEHEYQKSGISGTILEVAYQSSFQGNDSTIKISTLLILISEFNKNPIKILT